MKMFVVCMLVAGTASLLMGCAQDKKPEERTSVTTASSAKAIAGHVTCNMVAIAGKCDEYGREDPLGMTQSLCEGFKGTYGPMACPQDGLVGTCTLAGEDKKRYYVTKDELTSFSPEDARKDCESDLWRGKFTAAPNPPKKPTPSASASAASSGAPAASAVRTPPRH